MQVTFSCPRCQEDGAAELSDAAQQLTCGSCDFQWAVPHDASADGGLRRCVVCSSRDLFVRKDFPQSLGVAIVVAGFAVSCIPWYYREPLWTFAVLFATALADVALYMIVGDSLCCYRCGAEYRHVQDMQPHGGFELETHERYRQEAARLHARTENVGHR